VVETLCLLLLRETVSGIHLDINEGWLDIHCLGIKRGLLATSVRLLDMICQHAMEPKLGPCG